MDLIKRVSFAVKMLFLPVAGTLLSGCATPPVPLPDNVMLSAPGAYGHQYIDRIELVFENEQLQETNFSEAIRCVPLNISNSDVALRDASGSFFGAYTGHYYQFENRTSVSGGNVIQAIDNESGTIVAQGNTSFVRSSGLMPINWFVRYAMVLRSDDSRIEITFGAIEAALGNTGYLSNTGFAPVGNWQAAAPVEVIGALEEIANRIGSCVTG